MTTATATAGAFDGSKGPRLNKLSLSSVRKGIRPAPDRILLVGTEGIGKSTFAASAPSPVFIAAEDGVRHLDVASFPEPKTLSDVYEAFEVLRSETHEFGSVVVDTIDWLEPLVYDHVCRRNGWDGIEAPGYGKGYTAALDEWRMILKKLDILRERGLEVILLAHAKITNFANPTGPDYSRYELGMHKNSAAIIKQWADVVLFATYDDNVALSKTPRDEAKAVHARGKALTGARIMHTERTAAWDAKNRHNLPSVLPLSYDEYAAAREANRASPNAALIAEFESLLDQVKDETKRERARMFVGDKSDHAKLAQGIAKLRLTIQAQE